MEIDLERPSKEDQCAAIKTFERDRYSDYQVKGADFAVISCSWFSKWKAYTGYKDGLDEARDGGEAPGAILNAPLLDENQKLKRRLLLQADYVMVTKDSFDLLSKWHVIPFLWTLSLSLILLARFGCDVPIFRKMIELPSLTGRPRLMVEVYSLVFKILNIGKSFSDPVKIFEASKSMPAVQFIFHVASFCGLPPAKTFFWIKSDLPDATWIRIDRASAKDKILDDLGLEEFNTLQATTVGGYQPDAGKTPQLLSDPSDPNSDSLSTIELKRPAPVERAPSYGPALSSYFAPAASSYSSSRYEFRNNYGDDDESKYDRPGPHTPGLCGLTNLGNTCFMNSAVQCLSNTPALKDYFTSGKWKEHLNPTNPIGSGGEIARAYASLVKRMWSGHHTSFSPTQLKRTIGQFAPQFEGYRQHDSQELLAFLLDGLHEDLNQILKKPFTEGVEANGRPDAVVAAEAWEIFLKRNKSFIVELFQGQLKSTVSCPDPSCGNVSVTFDPMMYLTLPIPVPKKKINVNIVVKQGQEIVHTSLQVPLASGANVSVLRRELANYGDGSLSKYNFVFGRSKYSSSDEFFVLDDDDVVRSAYSDSKIFAFATYLPFNETVTLMVYNVVKRDPNFSYSTTTNLGLPIPVQLTSYSLTPYKDLLVTPGDFWSAYWQQCFPRGSSDKVSNDAMEEDPVSSIPSGHDGTLPPLSLISQFPAPQDFVSVPRELTVQKVGDYRPLSSTEEWKFSHDFQSLQVIWPSKKAYETHFPAVRSEPPSAASDDEVKRLGINDCLKSFLLPEKLGKEDTWFCPKCKQSQEATKKFDLWKLPKVLIVHFKRFSGTREGKISTPIDFPDTLDMTPWVISEAERQENPLYRLFAVSDHSGGTSGGHYVAYAKNHQLNKWYEFNDSSVHPCRADACQSGGAYVLFYERIEAGWSIPSGDGEVEREEKDPGREEKEEKEEKEEEEKEEKEERGEDRMETDNENDPSGLGQVGLDQVPRWGF